MGTKVRWIINCTGRPTRVKAFSDFIDYAQMHNVVGLAPQGRDRQVDIGQRRDDSREVMAAMSWNEVFVD